MAAAELSPYFGSITWPVRAKKSTVVPLASRTDHGRPGYEITENEIKFDENQSILKIDLITS